MAPLSESDSWILLVTALSIFVVFTFCLLIAKCACCQRNRDEVVEPLKPPTGQSQVGPSEYIPMDQSGVKGPSVMKTQGAGTESKLNLTKQESALKDAGKTGMMPAVSKQLPPAVDIGGVPAFTVGGEGGGNSQADTVVEMQHKHSFMPTKITPGTKTEARKVAPSTRGAVPQSKLDATAPPRYYDVPPLPKSPSAAVPKDKTVRTPGTMSAVGPPDVHPKWFTPGTTKPPSPAAQTKPFAIAHTVKPAPKFVVAHTVKPAPKFVVAHTVKPAPKFVVAHTVKPPPRHRRQKRERPVERTVLATARAGASVAPTEPPSKQRGKTEKPSPGPSTSPSPSNTPTPRSPHDAGQDQDIHSQSVDVAVEDKRKKEKGMAASRMV